MPNKEKSNSANLENPIAGAIYEHYKTGKKYKVIGIGKHSETLEDLVFYEALYENVMSKLWARPLRMFTEEVEWKGKTISRFRLLKSS